MTAIFSPDRKYRYRLERDIQPEGKLALIIMVNPSVAAEEKDDPTVKKLIGFGRALGWRGLVVVNLFALVATDIKGLRGVADPKGSDNAIYIAEAMTQTDLIVAGWGALAKLPEILRKRWIDIVRMADDLDKKLYCLGINDDGHPKHPLMTGYDVPLTEWTAPWFPNRGKK